MHRVRVIKRGRSQMIRLPKELHVDANEVYLKKAPEGFLVMTRDPWELFYEAVEKLSDDFMSQGRKQPPFQRRKWDL